jgi:hypothetical protein
MSELTVMPLTDQVGIESHFLGTLCRVGGVAAPEHSPPCNASLTDSAVAAAFLAHPSMGRAQSAASANSHTDLDVSMTQRRDGPNEGDGSPRLHPSPGPSRKCFLSRKPFPLHNLSDHPIAPVLLRMLQVLASCLGML